MQTSTNYHKNCIITIKVSDIKGKKSVANEKNGEDMLKDDKNIIIRK
jgi:hypothetical protein